MPQIREQIAMVHLPPSKTLKYLFHVRKTVFYNTEDTHSKRTLKIEQRKLRMR